MNSQDTKPPDKDKSNVIVFQNDSIFIEIEIKQEPTVKQKPEEDDEIVMVSRSTYTANGLLDNLIGNEQLCGTYNFVDSCDLADGKSEVKVIEVKGEATKVRWSECDRVRSAKNNGNNRSMKQTEQKSSEPNSDSIRKAGGVKKNRKANSAGDTKKPSKAKANRKLHKCSLCNYITNVETNLNQHKLKHTGQKPFPCSVCQKRFTSKQNLQSHMKTHVSEFLFSCSTCFQGFHHYEEKVEHEAGCTIRRYECHLCKEFSGLHKTNLENHLRIHSGDRPFQCDQCSKKFTRQNNLKHHRKTHTNPPRPLKFKCAVCFKNFTQQEEKEDHEANCKRRGYKCEVCKRFTTDQKKYLVKHIRIHTGEKPFQCEICSKCFVRKGCLIRHKKIHK